MTIAFDELINGIVQHEIKVLLLGEWHQYIGDTAVVLRIASALRARGRRLVFYMEHFPGPGAMKDALAKAMGSSQQPKGWKDIHEFLDTKIETEGKGVSSPMEAWTNIEQRKKLEAILRFAQMSNIEVKGHDLPYADQIKYLTGGKKYGENYMEREAAHLKARDQRMFLHYQHFVAHHPLPQDMVMGFVGEAHAEPQYKRLQGFAKCIYLKPDRACVNLMQQQARPIVSSSVVFEKKGVNYYEFKNP